MYILDIILQKMHVASANEALVLDFSRNISNIANSTDIASIFTTNTEVGFSHQSSLGIMKLESYVNS